MVIGGQRYGPFYAALPGTQGDLTPHGQLAELDRLIALSQEVRKNPQSPIVWEFGVVADGSRERYAPVFLTSEFQVRVERVLAQIATMGAGEALRRFRQINFWQSKDGFRIEESRAPEPSAETRRKYARLVGKVGIYLAGVREREFFGVPLNVADPRGSAVGPRVARRKKASARDRNRAQSPQYSQADARRYERIGHDQIKSHTNTELWVRCRKDERKLRGDITWQAFRHSLNRVRDRHNLPSSEDVRKKVTSVGHSQSDQK